MWSSPNRKVFPSPQPGEAEASKPKDPMEEEIPRANLAPRLEVPPPPDYATATGQHEYDEELIDLTNFTATEDEDDADYVPESLRSFVQQANDRLRQETQGFYSTLVPHSTDSQDAEETDMSLPPFNPANMLSPSLKSPPPTMEQVQETKDDTPAAQSTETLDGPPQPTALFSSPALETTTESIQQASHVAEQEVSFIGDLDETQVLPETEPELHELLQPEQFDLDPIDDDIAEAEEFETAEPVDIVEEPEEPQAAILSDVECVDPDISQSRQEPSPRNDSPIDTSVITDSVESKPESGAMEHMAEFLVEYNPSPDLAEMKQPSSEPIVIAEEDNNEQAASSIELQPSSSHVPPPNTQPMSPEKPVSPQPLSFWGRLAQPMFSTAKDQDAPVATSTQLPTTPIEKAEASEKKQNALAAASLERLTHPTAASRANEHEQPESESIPAGTTPTADNHAVEKKRSPISASSLQRLAQPTAASKAKEHEHHEKDVVESPKPGLVDRPTTGKGLAPNLDHLLQPTSASKAKEREHVDYHPSMKHVSPQVVPSGPTSAIEHVKAEDETNHTLGPTPPEPVLPECRLSPVRPKSGSPSVSLLDRLSQPTSASKLKEREHHDYVPPLAHGTTTVAKKAAPPPIDTTHSPATQEHSLRQSSIDRLTRPTVSSAAHEVHAGAQPLPDDHVPLNSLKGESVSTPLKSIPNFAGVNTEEPSPIQTVASPERGNDAQEKGRNTRQSLMVVSRSTASRLSTSAADQAVAAARARVRQARMRERTTGTQQEKENKGKLSKPPVPRMGPAKTERRSLTIPKTPNFATTTKLGASKHNRRDQLADMTLAQSTDLLQRGLRDPNVSFTSASAVTQRARTLTIPKSPSFATTAKYGEKRQSLSSNGQKGATPPLAQSNEVLANQLRKFPANLTTSTRRKVTLPVSPKFHASSKRHGRDVIDGRSERIESKFLKPISRVSKPAVPRVARMSLASSAPTQSRDIALEAAPKSAFKARPMPDFSKSAVKIKPAMIGKAGSLFAGGRSSSGPEFAGDKEEAKPFTFKAKPVPASTYKPPQLKSPASASASVSSGTAAKPFQLESERRHEQYQAKLQEKLKEQEEQEKLQRQFHAKEFKCPPPPEQCKSSKAPTTPVPFQLASLDRHEKSESEIKQRIAEEEEELRRLANFKAAPVPKSIYESPALSERLVKAEEERRRKEVAQDEERRKAAVFKARPVPKSMYEYIPISPKLTSPKPSVRSDEAPQTS